MSDQPTEAERLEKEEETGAHPVEVPPSKGRPALSKVRRELTDKELTSAGVIRMLVAEGDRLEKEVDELRRYRDRYYEAEKQRAILAQRLKVSVAADVVFGVCLTVGAALVSIAPAVWANKPYGWLLLVLGLVLMGGGIVAKVVNA
jgi:hypothetical protein